MSPAVVLAPDFVWRDHGLHRGLAVELAGDGRIARVGPHADLAVRGKRIERLPATALLPGLVNAHSHAFQRIVRGRAQWRPAGTEADFWTWRTMMYAVANALTPDDVEAVARHAFLEMIRAGITAVGEFHYLRNDPGGRPYDDPHEIAQRVIAAAREVGLRIVLLDAAYATGGVDEPLDPAQRRFATPDLDRHLGDALELAARWAEEPAVSIGVAPHSVRAVPREWLGPIARWAAERGTALHAHVAEQTAEVVACREAYGVGPVELLAREGVLSDRFTAVHATHVEAAEIDLLARARATVCACPTTERDLGDGFLPAAELVRAGVPIALGSDNQSAIDPFEEMRLVELHERLRHRRRVVVGVERGDRVESAPALWAMATEAGARSLGIDAGRIEPGAWADLVAVDLEAPALAGWTEASLPALLAFAGAPPTVAHVWVGGERRLTDRRHELDERSLAAFRAVAARIAPE